jgi:hypothetical protein
MGPIRCPETSVNNYHTTPCNNPEDHTFQVSTCYCTKKKHSKLEKLFMPVQIRVVLKCVQKGDIYLTNSMEMTPCWEGYRQNKRFSQQCCWGFKSSGTWCSVVRWVVPDMQGQTALNCWILKALHSFKTSRTTHPMTQCNIPEDMMNPWQVSHLDKKLPTVYETWRFVTIFITTCLLLSHINPITPPHHISWRPLLTLTSYACVDW